MMGSLRQSGAYGLPENLRAAISTDLDVGTATEAETMDMIASVHANSGYLLDPHTTVALVAARKQGAGDGPMVTLSTAHPAKFPATVQKAIGICWCCPRGRET